jgi:hypothetical protein
MHALRVGSAALAAAGNAPEARRWAVAGLEAAPDRSKLAPRELFEVATLELRSGDRAAARALAGQLDRIGYRSPEYLQTRKAIFADN